MTAIINGLLTGSAYALIAVGFVMIYKGSRIFNLAHGEIGGFGLYIAWDLQNRGVPVLLAFVLGIIVATLAAVVVERTLVRRLVDRTPLAALACTLGVAFVLAYAEVLHYGANVKSFPPPFGASSFHLGSYVPDIRGCCGLGSGSLPEGNEVRPRSDRSRIG
jgi:branched-chain amino acid transport system permease protein